jgi:hypothetical protein
MAASYVSVLARLDSEFADDAPHETLHTRWIRRQVLDALGDTRAAPLLTHLHADVQAPRRRTDRRGGPEAVHPGASGIPRHRGCVSEARHGGRIALGAAHSAGRLLGGWQN